MNGQQALELRLLFRGARLRLPMSDQRAEQGDADGQRRGDDRARIERRRDLLDDLEDAEHHDEATDEGGRGPRSEASVGGLTHPQQFDW